MTEKKANADNNDKSFVTFKNRRQIVVVYNVRGIGDGGAFGKR
jgi:hypothetical protein